MALFTWHVSGEVKTRFSLKLNSLQVGKGGIMLCHRFVAALIVMDYKATLQIMCAFVTAGSLAFQIHSVTESKVSIQQHRSRE